MRKKKLKEAACNRREIIGPQLPATGDDQIVGDVFENECPEGVRSNAEEKLESGNDHNHSKTTSYTGSFIIINDICHT